MLAVTVQYQPNRQTLGPYLQDTVPIHLLQEAKQAGS